MKKIAIIVAAGIGNRMQSEIPKQFLPLANQLVLMHSIQKFHDIGAVVYVTIHPDYQEFWKNACQAHQFSVPHHIVLGGKERFHSIQNAIRSIQEMEDTLVAVHDAARPNISPKLIQYLYHEASQCKAVIPAVKPTDTIRNAKNNRTLNREDFWLVQTPQIFELNLLKRAYQQVFTPLFTDDASVVEALGFPIKIIEGDKFNIKITFPEDLTLLSYLIS